MKLTGWKERFAPQILRRGEDYFYSGAVRSLSWDGAALSAVVSGTDDYAVEITVSGGAVEDMDCDCPYAEQDNCKHMAAALFAASQDDFPGAADPGGASGRKAAPTLEKAVQSLSASDARALLARFAAVYPDIAEQVMMKTTGRVTKKQIQAWYKQITSLTVKYSDRYGVIDYRSSGKYIEEMETLMDGKVQILLDSGLPMEAFRLTCRAMEEVSEAGVDDFTEVEAMYWDCAEQWNAIIPHLNRAERHEMFDWIQENYSRWEAEDFVDAFLFGSSYMDAAFPEAEFLRRKLDLLDEQIAKAKENGYRIDRYTLRRVETMEKLSMDRAEIDAYLQANRQIPAVRKRMVDAAVREGRYDDAISLLREGKETTVGTVAEYSNQLVELYRTLDRVEDLRTELLFQMEEVGQRDLGHVELLKELTPNDQWPDLRERLLSLGNLRSVRGELLEAEGLYDRLLDYAVSSGSLYVMDAYADTLGARYPADVLAFYIPHLRKDMERASTRTQYAEQVKRLKQLTRFRGGKEAAAEAADEWRTAYPRRRAMWEELQKAGF